MPEVSETTRTDSLPPVRAKDYFSPEREEEIFYPEQRTDDIGETSIHAKLVNSLMAMLLHFFEWRGDIFLSSNMNLYYEEGNPKKWYAPDLLIAFNVSNRERSSYQVWKEKVFPQVIFEVASASTWKEDVGEKYEIYERFGVEEYYILDPELARLPAPLMAFRRQGERLLAAAVNDDRIFSPRLNLEIVRTANNFRLFNPQTNEFLRTLEEAESEVERLKAEIERLENKK